MSLRRLANSPPPCAQVLKTQVARKKSRKKFKDAAKTAADGCRMLLEHKCSDSATDLGQQMLELYTEANIEESEESLGEWFLSLLLSSRRRKGRTVVAIVLSSFCAVHTCHGTSPTWASCPRAAHFFTSLLTVLLRTL